MTKKKPKESLAELQKQREDIEALLASIEEAYSEGSMPEGQYQEVKEQNEAKLQEINEKIDKVAMEGGAEAAVPAPNEEKAPETKPEDMQTPPPLPTQSQSAGQISSAAQPLPAPTPISAQTPQPVTMPAQPPATQSAPPHEEKTSTKIEMPKEIIELIKSIKEGKIGNNAELMKRVEKVEVELEKVKSFVDAMKDERSSYDERIQRVSEEVGELRTNLNTIDGRLGEVEIKADESNDIVKNLKPQKIAAALEERDNEVKAIKARIEKIEDVISNTLKKVGEIREILRSLGSIDNLANMSRDIAKKVLIIDDRVKKMERMSERIDTIFGELNKRLEEFMFYKAKQQSIDELTHDLMRNIQEIDTKLDSYAQKTDLDTMKNILLSKIEESKAQIPAVSTTPPMQLTGPEADVQKQINDLKELDSMLDEQKNMGALTEDEYKKSKEANQKKMEELKKKMEELKSGAPEQSPQTASEEPQQPTEQPNTQQNINQQPPVQQSAASENTGSSTEIPSAEQVQTPEQTGASPNPELPTQAPQQSAQPIEKELKKESTPFGEMYKLEEKTKPEVKPENKETKEENPEQTKKPKNTEIIQKNDSEPKQKETNHETEEQEFEESEEEVIKTKTKKGMNRKERMLIELEDSFRKGLLSEKAYFRAKKLLGLQAN